MIFYREHEGQEGEFFTDENVDELNRVGVNDWAIQELLEDADCVVSVNNLLNDGANVTITFPAEISPGKVAELAIRFNSKIALGSDDYKVKNITSGKTSIAFEIRSID